MGHCYCKTSTISRTEMGKTDAFTGMPNGSGYHLMVMIMRAISLIQELMHFLRTGPYLTSFFDESICFGNLETKGTHVKHRLLGQFLFESVETQESESWLNR